ncbi:unnamed protein product [Arctogadus glacialis]
MRRHHQTTFTDPGRGPEARMVPGPAERNTDHHAVAAFQREGPVEGTVVRIHTTLGPAPFLKHPQLTPAQRRYLGAAAGPRSAERVYGLVNRHYLNVLRRSIRPGPLEEEDGMALGPAEAETALEPEEPQSKTGGRGKHKQPIKTAAAAKHSGKTSLTKLSAKKRPRAKVQPPKAKQNKNKTETGHDSRSELLAGDDLEASLRQSLSSLSMEDDLDSVNGDSPR